MRLLLLVTAVAGLLSGCDSAEFASYNFKLRTDRDHYSAADLVVVTLGSEVSTRAEHGLCNATLEKQVGGIWEAARRTQPGCAYSPSYIYPGESVSDTLYLSDWVVEQGAAYRFDAGIGAGAVNFGVASNSFIIE